MDTHTVGSDVRCVGLYCRDEGSHIAADHLFRPLKQHWGVRRFNSNEEMVMAVCECKSPIYNATEILNSRRDR